MKPVTINDIKNENAEFVLPENNRFVLPKGCIWTQDVYNEMKFYGLFQQNRKIYIVAKEPDIVEEDGTEIEDKKIYFKVISNFEIRILQHIDNETKPMRLVQIVNVENLEKTFETLSDNFTSINLFKKMVEGFGNYFFKGTTSQYDKLKAYLMDKMGYGRMISVLGWQKEGFFAMQNKAFDTNGNQYDYEEYGTIKFKNKQYYIPSANILYQDSEYKFKNEKAMKFVDSGVSFSELSKLTSRVHGNNAHIAMTFAVATVFSDLIAEYVQAFPMIFFYGAASTGKSQLIKTVQTLWGVPQQPITITGKANTDKAKIRKFAQFVNTVVFMEEYSNQVPSEVIEMLKSLHDRIGYERGNIETRFGTETVPIQSTVMITGNDYPTNDPLLTRLIIAEFENRKLTAEDRNKFDQLKDMMLQGYSDILAEIVKLRKKFEKEFIPTYKNIKQEINLMFLGCNLENRMIDNVAILVTTHRLSNKELDYGFSEGTLKDTLKNAIITQNNKRDSGGEVAKFWETFLVLYKNDEIKLNQEFKLDGNDLIFFNSRIQPLYYKKHFEIFRSAGISKSSMIDKIKKHSSFIKMNSVWIGKSKSTAIRVNMLAISEDFRNDMISISIEKGFDYVRPADWDNNIENESKEEAVLQTSLDFEDPFK